MSDLRRPMFFGSQPRVFSLENLFLRALQHSSRIRVLSDTPLIRETGIQEAKGEFDTLAFIEGKYAYTNNPLAPTSQPATSAVPPSLGPTTTTSPGLTDPALVGDDPQAAAAAAALAGLQAQINSIQSQLATAAAASAAPVNTPDTLKGEEYSLETGVSKKFATGTQVSLNERVSRFSDNSLSPDSNLQSTARLTLSIVQPLLRGAGLSYNLAGLNIARIDSQIARMEFIRESEAHLIEINRAYWDLYFARAVYQQRKRLVQETQSVAGQTEVRTAVDVPQSQLLRVRSALAERKAELIRSEAAIRNAQDRIIALINDPELTALPQLEMIPAEISLLPPVDVDLEAVAGVALWKRTEIDQAFAQIRDAAIREKVAKNEILPRLDLIMEGYLAGIKRGGDVVGALDRQNKDEVPGFAIGFRFEFPFENNSAKARLRRQLLLTRQRFNALRLTIETILLETQVSVREVKTSARDVEAKYETVVAASADLRNLQARRSLILGFDEVSAINYIEYYLDSQERESRAQEALIQTVTNYRVSLLNLERVKGNLLSYKDVVYIPKGADKLPALVLDPPRPMLRANVPLRSF